jgi:fructosamine-3-kinase
VPPKGDDEGSATEESGRLVDLPEDAGTRLAWVLDRTALFPEISTEERISLLRVEPLSGGADARTFLVRCDDHAVVVKLNETGLEAEAEALNAWKPYGGSLPDVLGVGALPSTGGPPVKYLVLSALVNDDGGVVETAAEYLDRSPESAREVGRTVGAELYKMHEAVCPTGFGNFADTPGAERTYRNWNTYLEEFLGFHADFVKGFGLGDADLAGASAFIRGCRFVEDARYLHGDVSIRNVAITAYRPLSVGLFDPNPVSGDPSWDLAPMVNNVEFHRREDRRGAASSKDLTRDEELVAGFRESYPPEVAEESLLAAQLILAVLQAEHLREVRAGRADAAAQDPDAEVVHDFVRDVVRRMAS